MRVFKQEHYANITAFLYHTVARAKPTSNQDDAGRKIVSSIHILLHSDYFRTGRVSSHFCLGVYIIEFMRHNIQRMQAMGKKENRKNSMPR
jgi:hypothetical protein